MKTITKIFAGLAMLGAVACQMYEIDTQMTPEKAAASIRMECSAVDTYNLPAQNPGNITFNVSSNTPWTITLSSGADWLTVTPASSASSALITDVVVTAQNNTNAFDRSATLTLRGDNIANAKVVTIKQTRAGKLFVTPMVSDYSAAGGPLSFTIQTNQAWTVRSSAGWLTFNRENGEPDPEGRTLTIIATAAASTVLERTATVTVTAGDQEESFDVVQKGTFTVTEISGVFDALGEAKTFSVKTDLPWEVSCDKGWLTFDATSGTGDGTLKTITATAAANDGALRKANVTVSAGGVDKTFEVSQAGFTFEIVAPASTDIPAVGGEIILNVNTSINWDPSTDVSGWSVEKIDASSFKVKMGYNDIFKEKTGKVSINGVGGAKDEIEFTQALGFKFEGHTEVLEDGSVKVYEDVVSKVTTTENFRFVKMTLTMGEVHFTDKGQLWVTTKGTGDCNIYNQITLGVKIRLRTDGTMITGAKSTYANTEYAISVDEMNAMTTYGFEVVPEPENVSDTLDDSTVIPHHVSRFIYNGTERAKLSSRSGIADDPTVSNPYSFGGNSENFTATESWFIVKSCTIIPVEG